ncbi:MAG: hypothetical protein GY730_04230 [bacterium]|nr:hypothetical protein [bacterium]
MDDKILDSIADMICGDRKQYPVYRTGSELTDFFKSVGFSGHTHDGSTRKWWTLNVLKRLTENDLKAVLLRLANPLEYTGDQGKTEMAINELNKIISIVGLRVVLNGVDPSIIKIDPQFPPK